MQDGLKRVLDYSDYLAAPDDGKRYEILRGVLLVTPAPRPVHQRVVVRLVRVLSEYFEDQAAEVFVSPIDLILSNNDVLQPDLLVVNNPASVTDRGIEGPPLLIVEVLSETTADRDRGVKAQRYAELSVDHYWLVDPATQRVECYKLAGGAYQRVPGADPRTRLVHPDFPDLDLSLD